MKGILSSFILLIILCSAKIAYAYVPLHLHQLSIRSHAFATKNVASSSTGRYRNPSSSSSLMMSEIAAVGPKETKKTSKLWDAYLKTTDTLTTLFPLWTVLFAGLALTRPESFAWFSTKYFTASLGIMSAMIYIIYQMPLMPLYKRASIRCIDALHGHHSDS